MINVLPREALAHIYMCDKKQIARESDEVIVGIGQNTKGPNVYIVRITISKIWIVSNEG